MSGKMSAWERNQLIERIMHSPDGFYLKVKPTDTHLIITIIADGKVVGDGAGVKVKVKIAKEKLKVLFKKRK